MSLSWGIRDLHYKLMIQSPLQCRDSVAASTFSRPSTRSAHFSGKEEDSNSFAGERGGGENEMPASDALGSFWWTKSNPLYLPDIWIMDLLAIYLLPNSIRIYLKNLWYRVSRIMCDDLLSVIWCKIEPAWSNCPSIISTSIGFSNTLWAI